MNIFEEFKEFFVDCIEPLSNFYYWILNKIFTTVKYILSVTTVALISLIINAHESDILMFSDSIYHSIFSFIQK